MSLACAGGPTAPCDPSPSPSVPFSFTDFRGSAQQPTYVYVDAEYSTVLSAGRWASIYLILLLLWVLRSLGCLWCLYDLGVHSALAGSCVKCDQRALGARRARGSSQCAHHLPSSTLIGPMCVASWEEVGRLAARPPCRCGALFRGRPACSSHGGRGPHPHGPRPLATKIIHRHAANHLRTRTLTDKRIGRGLSFFFLLVTV